MVSELMRTQEGRDFWQKTRKRSLPRGIRSDAEQRESKVLDGLPEGAGEARPAGDADDESREMTNDHPGGWYEMPDFTEEDEAAADAAWDRIHQENLERRRKASENG
jgi:hypothetical protein